MIPTAARMVEVLGKDTTTGEMCWQLLRKSRTIISSSSRYVARRSGMPGRLSGLGEVGLAIVGIAHARR